VRKQPNVYSDISGLVYRPSRLYFKLLSCMEYGVMDKLVLGCDFPFGTTRQVMDELRKINRYSRGTQFPEIPRASIEAVISGNADRFFEKTI
jgi:predicted TIM-barrel fold metal-dependent hydrolase